MLEAVFLGVRGVLLPRLAFEAAVIDAAARRLTRHGVSRDAFRAAATRRLATEGPRALLSLSLQDLGVHLAPGVIRSVWLEARSAVPAIQPAASFRDALRDVAARFEIGFVDAGHPDVLDSVLHRSRLADLPGRRLWTEGLGRMARPPRGLAFRWLSRRLGSPPAACLYVAGSGSAWKAAEDAGWRVWPPRVAPAGAALDPWEIVDGVEQLAEAD